MYQVTIKKILEDGSEEIMHDAKSVGLFAIVDSEDGKRFAEIVYHQNLMDMAGKIAQSGNIKRAAQLSMALGNVLDKMATEDAENDLLSQILGNTDLQ